MIGERVKLAREARQLTQVALSGVAGISQGTLSDVETGRITEPAPAVIEAVARATMFPTSFFYLGPLPDLPEGYYRKLKRGSSKVDHQIRAEVRQLTELVQRAEKVLTLPPVSLEPRREVSDLAQLEDVAADTREALRVGRNDPIPNLIRAVERAGVVVVPLSGSMDDHQGFSVWPDFGLDGRPILALPRGNPGDRDRFTTAHEVGHLVLHTIRRAVEPTQAEREANRFAGALLLPEEAAREAMQGPITLRSLMDVKTRFGTSIAVGAQRALDLGLITRDHFVSLRKQLSARGWTKAEPIEVPSEQPLVIKKIMKAMGGTGSLQDQAGRAATPLFTYRALTA